MPRAATTASRVPSRPPRRGLARGAAALLALPVVALLAQAATVAVVDNSTVDTVYAERAALALRFEVVRTELGRAAVALAAAGTEDAPLEMLEAPTPGWTALAPGDWTYTVTVLERDADDVRAGTFVVELSLDGEPKGAVRFAQAVRDPLVREGVAATFSLGAARPTAPLYVVTVKEIVPPGIAYRLRSVVGETLQSHWQGVGGEIEGEINPALTSVVGRATEFTVVNGDNGFHRFLVRNAAGATVAGPTPDIATLNDEQVLVWTPDAAGAYTYVCDYHPDSMSGTIAVE